MLIRRLIFSTVLFLISILSLSAQTEEEAILQVVDQFFQALEEQDTAKFQDLFLENSFNYYVRDLGDSAKVGGRSAVSNRFRPDRIIKERLQEEGVEVKIHKRIAMVWAPYNLWINDDFSHCGVDVFTLLKTDEDWRISSVSYSMEADGCDEE